MPAWSTRMVTPCRRMLQRRREAGTSCARRAGCHPASANWMITLISSGCRASAAANRAGGSRRVTRRDSHDSSARMSASCACTNALVRVHAPDNDVVPEDHGGRRVGDRSDAAAPRPDSSQADDAARSDDSKHIRNHLSDAGAFDHHVRLEAQVRDRPRMARRAHLTHQLRLQAGLDTVEDAPPVRAAGQ